MTRQEAKRISEDDLFNAYAGYALTRDQVENYSSSTLATDADVARSYSKAAEMANAYLAQNPGTTKIDVNDFLELADAIMTLNFYDENESIEPRLRVFVESKGCTYGNIVQDNEKFSEVCGNGVGAWQFNPRIPPEMKVFLCEFFQLVVAKANEQANERGK